MKDYKEEFSKFLEMLNRGENFGLSRFSDGEIFILKNQKLVLERDRFVTGERSGIGRYTEEEEKSYDPTSHEHISHRLKDCLSSRKKNYFKGLSCNEDTDICLEDDVLKYQILLSPDDEEHLTFSNVFINANYPRFINEFLPVLKSKQIVFVANESADLTKLGLNIIKDFRIGSNCFVTNYDLPSEINEWIEGNDTRGVVFLISASTLSNFIVKDCFFKHPENTYIDIGSSLNPWMGLEGWQYSRAYLQHWILGNPNKYGTQEDSWS